MKLFLPQKTLEDWAIGEKADLVEGKLVVRETKTTHPATPAVHFLKVVSGNDSHELVGRVKTIAQIEMLGGESMADSVILGDDAYEVVTGFITEVQPPPVQTRPDPKKKGTSTPEADLLAAFILDKL